MMTMEREVVIVLSSEFGSKLNELAMSNHVWAVQTAETEEVAQRIREERPPQEADLLTSGITLFAGAGDAERDLLSIIDTIELHHGIAGGHLPTMDAVRTLGIGPTDAIREALGSLGFTHLVAIPDGFIAYRDPLKVDR
jgi:hypothetical protein